MKTSKIIAAAALTLLAAAGALKQEPMKACSPSCPANSRATISAEAVTAAHRADPYADGATSGVIPRRLAASATTRPCAVAWPIFCAAAHSADPYAEGATAGAAPILASTINRDAVRAEARAAAHGNSLAL